MQSKIIDISQRLSKLLEDSNLTWRSNTLLGLKNTLERFRSEDCHIVLVGDFARGKSTFLNVLIGANAPQVFIASPSPSSTAGLLHWAEEAQLRVTSGKKEKKIKDIQDFVQQKAESNQYSLIDYAAPIPLLANKISFEELAADEELDTLRAVSNADFVIMFLSVTALYSQTEANLVEKTLKALGHQSIFFFANFMDQLDEEEQKSIRAFGLRRIPAEENHLFFGSLRQALKGEDEGLNLLLEQLNQLSNNAQSIVDAKQARLLMYLQSIVQDCEKEFNAAKKEQERSIQASEKNHKTQQEGIQKLRTIKDNISSILLDAQKDLEETIKIHAENFFNGLASDESLLEMLPKTDSEYDLNQYLKAELEEKFSFWRENKLKPLVHDKLESLKSWQIDMQRFQNQANELLGKLNIQDLPLPKPPSHDSKNSFAENSSVAFAEFFALASQKTQESTKEENPNLVQILQYPEAIAFAVVGLIGGAIIAGIPGSIVGSLVGFAYSWQRGQKVPAKSKTSTVLDHSLQPNYEVIKKASQNIAREGSHILADLEKLIQAELGGFIQKLERHLEDHYKRQKPELHIRLDSKGLASIKQDLEKL